MDWLTIPTWSNLLLVVAIPLFLFLARTWVTAKIKDGVKNEYDKRLEIHKSSLSLQNSVEVEKLRSQLQMVAMERQIRISRLHERRAEVIATLYARLNDLKLATREYVGPHRITGDDVEEENLWRAAKEAYNRMSEHFYPNAIFLPAETVKKVEALRGRFGEHFIRFAMNDAAGPPTERTKRLAALFAGVEDLTGQAMAELADEFRALLGDDSSTSTASMPSALTPDRKAS